MYVPRHATVDVEDRNEKMAATLAPVYNFYSSLGIR